MSHETERVVGCVVGLMSDVHDCGTPWEVSSGPHRALGPVANRFQMVGEEIPADFEYEYCPKCNVRNMTDALVARFNELEERLWLEQGQEDQTEEQKARKDATMLSPTGLVAAFEGAVRGSAYSASGTSRGTSMRADLIRVKADMLRAELLRRLQA